MAQHELAAVNVEEERLSHLCRRRALELEQQLGGAARCDDALEWMDLIGVVIGAVIGACDWVCVIGVCAWGV